MLKYIPGRSTWILKRLYMYPQVSVRSFAKLQMVMQERQRKKP